MPQAISGSTNADGVDRLVGAWPAAAGPKRVRAREDTGEGCDALADCDLARAAAADTENARLKFERSAASWRDRAEMLRDVEVGLARRAATTRARNKQRKAAVASEGQPSVSRRAEAS